MTSNHIDVDSSLAAKHNVAILKEGQIATQNKRGMQMASRSPLFEAWVASCDGNHPLADLGCAYGLNAMEAIRRGLPVIGIDLGEEHFPYVRDLYQRGLESAHESYGTLELMTGSLTETINIPNDSLSGILVGEVLHFIPGEDILPAFKQLFSKLIPGGTLCLHCCHLGGLAAMPGGDQLKAEIERRQAEGIRWPGEMHDWDKMIQRDFDASHDNMPDSARPDFFHILTIPQVREAASAAGFTIVSLEAGDHPGYPSILRGPTSNLQLIARRPKPQGTFM